MSTIFLPDTNILIDMLNGSRRKLRRELAASHQVCLSLFVEGEFRVGLTDTARGLDSERSLDEFAALPNVLRLPPGDSVAKRYGEIYRHLRSKGRPIPTNDIWIAAHALDVGATLISNDAHFREIPFLDVRYAE